MTLEKLKREVTSQAERQRQEILDKAHAEEENIISEAKAKAKDIAARGKSEGERQAKELALELKASALLQAKRIESDAREEAVQGVLDNARTELKQFASSGRYEKTFEGLVREAVKSLGEKEFVLKVNARDKKLASKHGRVETIDTIGGVTVSKPDGSIQVNNTFEALLEQKEDDLRQEAFEQLFPSRKSSSAKAPVKQAKKKK